MRKKEITSVVDTIAGRSVPGGGFSEYSGTPFRADATALATLALRADSSNLRLLESARSRLASEQLADGRVCLAKDQPRTCWPTALAILAWYGSSIHRQYQDLAIHFLLKTKGHSSAKKGGAITNLDFSLVGWPWIEETFSWVEPTAMSMMALRLSGYGVHERVQEAVRLLMDRQLPHGGWNIGSTIIYGRETYPQTENTGMALAALSGQVDRKEIERSLDYLKSQVISSRTPLSLGWALFGLGAWGERPTEAKRWLFDCLSRQKKYGTYGTTLLSLILLVYGAKGGFLEEISQGFKENDSRR
jgi:hypothetical protein